MAIFDRAIVRLLPAVPRPVVQKLSERYIAGPELKDARETVRHILRHPMYAGALFFFVGTPLLLGSWWGLALAPVFALLLVVRIRIEEQTLRAALPGYDAYAAEVRYRLVPMVW